MIELSSRPAAATRRPWRRACRPLAQPQYPSLFPAPRQRWVDDLSLSPDELAAIAAPVLLIHGAQTASCRSRDGALALLDALPDARAHSSAAPATPRRSNAPTSSTD